MNMLPDTQPITFLSLYRKYGGNLRRAHVLEIQAAKNATSRSMHWMSAMMTAEKAYEKELVQKAQLQGKKPRCTNRKGMCEEDKCNC